MSDKTRIFATGAWCLKNVKRWCHRPQTTNFQREKYEPSVKNKLGAYRKTIKPSPLSKKLRAKWKHQQLVLWMWRVEGNEMSTQSNSGYLSKIALLFFPTSRTVKTVPSRKVLGREIRRTADGQCEINCRKNEVVYNIRLPVSGYRIFYSNGRLLHGRGEGRVFIIFRPSAALTEILYSVL